VADITFRNLRKFSLEFVGFEKEWELPNKDKHDVKKKQLITKKK
jgi:hypothetical protein